MIEFSPHAGGLPASETLAITARANQMKAEGVNVAPFAAGQPDFPTPDHVRDAGIQALRDGKTKYAPAAGIAPLRDAVAQRCRDVGFEGIEAKQTIVTVGAKGALYLGLRVLLREGDEVIVPTPDWLSYPQMVRAAGGRCAFVETRPEEGYAIDPDRIAAAVTKRSRAIILNSPGNPTGAVQSDEVQAAIGRIAVEHDLVVISDEIYEHLCYEPARFRSFAEAAPEARDLTLLVSGVSKAYAMTGWRIGYAAGPEEIVTRMVRLQSHALTGPPEFCQIAAKSALEGGMDEVDAMRSTFAGRRDTMHAALTSLPEIKCGVPDGAFYMLPDVSAFLGRRFEGKVVSTVGELAEILLNHAHAAVIPGHVFEAPYAIRLSYACSRESIEQGVGRVLDVLRQLEA